jgi:hypothetical protein
MRASQPSVSRASNGRLVLGLRMVGAVGFVGRRAAGVHVIQCASGRFIGQSGCGVAGAAGAAAVSFVYQWHWY